MLYPPFLYKKHNNAIIPGQFFRALVKHNDHYVQENLRVYADKTIAGIYVLQNLPIERLHKHMSKFFPKIEKEECIGTLGNGSDENINSISFEDFKYLVRKNFVTLNYKGAIRIELWGEPFTSDVYLIDVDMNITKDDFIKSLEDVFCKLNNQLTTIRIFLNTLCEFLQAPKEKKELYRKKLHEAYLNVPKYERSGIYPLTIDLVGRTPIEDILNKRKNRFDYYDDFVKMYDDIYFEDKYKNLNTKNLGIK